MDSIRITSPQARFLVPDKGLVERVASSVRELEGTLGAVFDTLKGKWVRSDGKKRTGRMDWFQTSVEALYEDPTLIADGSYHDAARFFCLEIPGETPEWKKTVADKVEEFRGSDDTFGAFDRGQHRAIVQSALMMGRPVPAEVLEDYALGSSGKPSSHASAQPEVTMPVGLPLPVATGEFQLGLFPEGVGGR